MKTFYPPPASPQFSGVQGGGGSLLFMVIIGDWRYWVSALDWLPLSIFIVKSYTIVGPLVCSHVWRVFHHQFFTMCCPSSEPTSISSSAWTVLFAYTLLHKRSVSTPSIQPGTHVLDVISESRNTGDGAISGSENIATWLEFPKVANCSQYNLAP